MRGVNKYGYIKFPGFFKYTASMFTQSDRVDSEALRVFLRDTLQRMPTEYVNPPKFNFQTKTVFKQLTELHKTFSDHRPAISDLGEYKILLFNMMMQNKKHIRDGKIVFNNGYCQEESDQQYQARIAHVMRTLIQLLDHHPEVNVIALQEAPIKPEDINIIADIIHIFLPSWHAAAFDMTDFGLMTFIRTEECQPKFYTDSELSQRLGKLADRCLTMTNGLSYKISNIHTQHSQSKASLQSILEILIDDAVLGKISRHDIVGDFNLDAAGVNEVLSQVWKNKCDAIKRSSIKYPALKLSALFESSPNGHRHADGSFINVVDADGALSLRFTCAKQNETQYSFQSARLHYYLLQTLFFGGMIGANILFNNAAITEAAVMAIM